MVVSELIRISRRILSGLNEVLKPWGLNASDWRIFRYLSEHEQGTISQIASAYDIDRAAISRIVTKLQSMDIIKPSSNDDKREKILKLSDFGKKIYFDANIQVKNFAQLALKDFSPLEQGSLLDLLDKINNNLEKIGEEK